VTGNNNHFSILTPNVNGLNALIKRYRIANWVKKNKNQSYVANQRVMSLKKIKIGLESKGVKMLSKSMDPINRQK
jgi:uncharacterized protein YdcH (DUF465 family)